MCVNERVPLCEGSHDTAFEWAIWQTRPGVRARRKRKAPRLCASVGLLAETAAALNEASNVQRETAPHQMSPKQTAATQAETQADQTILAYAHGVLRDNEQDASFLQ